MDAVYTVRRRVGASMCDASGKLGLWNTFALFQDVASEHAEVQGVGFEAMRDQGCFWMTVRTRVCFHDRPQIMRPVEVSTWAHAPGAMRCDRFYRLASQGAPLAEGRTEWCVYDLERQAVRPMSDVRLDERATFCEDTVLPAPYARFRHDFAEDEIACSHRVLPSDVDLGRHMNNVAYLRMICDSFDVAELERMDVAEMEILFCLPCMEGQSLDIMRRATDGGYEFGVRRPDGRYAALALMRVRK